MAETTEKVLTDDEKNALLEGVESGEVEVQSTSGATYASVSPFEIGPRARIIKDSYPRLQVMNQQIAEKLAKHAELLLQCEVSVRPEELIVRSYSEFCEQAEVPSVVIIFEAPPLVGRALLVMQPGIVNHLVDTFFGGVGIEVEAKSSTAFTPGEMSVASLFANVIFSTVREIWAPVLEITPERVSTEVSLDLVDIAAEVDPVIGSEFEVTVRDKQGSVQLLWPVETVQSLIPVFNGQKKDRDVVEDARWGKAISQRLAESVVSLSSDVGKTRVTLGELINLNAGDVIELESPQVATVIAEKVPLIHGRFGVHNGRNAVVASGWLEPEIH